MKKLLFSVFLLVLTVAFTGAAFGSALLGANEPLSFTENKGQYFDTQGSPRADLLFKAEQNGVDIYFQKNSVSYVFRQSDEGSESVKTLRSDLVFENANPNVVVKAGGALAARKNYALSGRLVEDVRSYGKIVYENLYDQIDLVFYTVEQDGASFIKYDFIVKPGGNPGDISARYVGAESLALTPAGGLEVRTALGRLSEDPPVCYQTTQTGKRKAVAGKFDLDGNVLKFKISGNYSAKQPLVIDPLTRQFASNYGGSLLDRATDVAYDDAGNALVTGFTASADFPTVAGQVQTFQQQNDAIVFKLDVTGQVVWSTFFGGALLDQGFGIAYSSAHKIFVTGYTTSPGLAPNGVPVLDAAYGGSGDGFVLNLEDDGSFRWFSYIGGTSNDRMTGVEINGGNLAITGTTFSSGVATNAFGGLSDGWVGVYTLNANPASNALNWARYLGGSAIDQGKSIAWSGAELVFAGNSSSSDYPVANAFQTVNAGSRDVVLTKLDNSGNTIWSTYYGGSASDIPNQVIADATGNIYVTGQTGSADFPILNEVQTDQGGNDAFVIGLDANGVQLMSTYLGGDGVDQAFGLATVNNHLYITGTTNSASGFPAIDPNAINLPFQTTVTGSFDLFLTKIAIAANSITWSVIHGASDDEVALAIQARADGTMALAGYTNSQFFDRLNPISGQNTAGLGNDDAAIIFLQDPFDSVCDFDVSFESSNPSCTDDQNGRIVVSAPVGSQYRYGLVGGNVNQSPQPSPVFTGLAGENYTLTVVNTLDNCTETRSISIINPPVIQLTAEGDEIECGETDGTITATGSGGSGDLRFSLVGPESRDFQDSPVFTGLQSGTYNVIAQDTNQCSSIATVEILPARLVSVSVQTGPATCGLDNGTLVYTSLSSGLIGDIQFTIRNLETDVVRQQTNLSTFNDVAPGIYQATVSDAENCSATIDQIEVPAKPFDLTVTASASQVACSDGTGTVTVNATGGQAPLTYRLNGGAPQASNTFTGLAPGTYTITVTDADDCSPANPVTVTVEAPAPINVTVDQVTETCAATTPASFTVNATGGNGGFTYSTDGGATFSNQNEYTNLSAGTLTIVVRDVNQCLSAPQNLEVVQNPGALQLVSANGVNPTCTGDTDGQIIADVINGTAPYYYVINGDTANSTTNFTYAYENLDDGTYNIEVRDANNCSVNATVTLEDPEILSISGVSATPPSACGLSDGTVSVTAEGGTGQLWYSFDGGQTFTTNNSRSTLFSGFYDIVVRDNDNIADFCEATDAIALNDPGAPSILNVQTINPLCSNDPALNNTGQLVVNTASNRTPVFFSLNSITGPFEESNAGGTSHTFSELSAGVYDGIVASVQDITGADCRAFWRAETLSAPDPIITEDVSIIQPTCGENPTAGGINVTASGGTGALAFSANGGATFTSESPITGLYPDPNGFDLRIRDSRGCTANAGRYFLFNASGLRLSSPVVNSPSCGGSDGSVTITPLGGTPPYVYTIDGGATTQTTNSPVTFSGLESGTYIVEVSDQSGCIAQSRIELTNLRVINKTVTRPTACGASDGMIMYEIDGGSGDYTYSYTGRVLDPANPTATPTSIATPVTGNFTTDYTVSGLAPGTYFFEVMDNANNASCMLRDTVIIDNTTGPNILSVVGQDRNCNLINGQGSTGRGAISIFGTGAATLTYMIDGPVSSVQVGTGGDFTTFNSGTPGLTGNLPAGVYQTYAIDGGTNCITTGGNIEITQPDAIEINDVVVTQPVCGQGASLGTIEIQAVGGNALEYSIDGGTSWVPSASFENIEPGATVYNVIAREAGLVNSCQFEWPFPIIISNTSGLTLSAAFNEPLCNGGTDGEISVVITNATVQRPYTYAINGSDVATTDAITFDFTGLSAGTYTVSVTDNIGCYAEQTVMVRERDPIVIAPVTTTPSAFCATQTGGEIRIEGTTGGTPNAAWPNNYQYAIDGGVRSNRVNYLNGSGFNFHAGVHTITAWDANNCTADTTVYIMPASGNELLISGIVFTDDADCNGPEQGSITVQGSPVLNTVVTINPIGFNTTFGTTELVPAGSYTISVTDFSTGCQIDTVITINQAPRPVLLPPVVLGPNCSDRQTGRIELTALSGSGNYEYSIDNGNSFQSGNVFNVLPSQTAATAYNASNGFIAQVRDVETGCLSQPSNIFVVEGPLSLRLDQGLGGPAPVVENESCAGAADGSIELEYGADNAPIEVYVNGMLDRTVNVLAGILQFNDLAAGSYEILLRDPNGCEVSTTLSVGTNNDLSVDVTIDQQPTACDADNGRINITVDGGDALTANGRTIRIYRNGRQLSRIFNNGTPLETESTISRGGLESGLYYVTVENTNQSSCIVSSDTFVIQDPGTPIINNVNVTPASNQICADGVIQVQATIVGTNPQYRLLANGGEVRGFQSIPVFQNVPAGDYTIEIRTGIVAPFCYSYGSATVGCTFSNTRSIDEFSDASAASLRVYPNPSNGTFNVSIENAKEGTYLFEVLDIAGKRIFFNESVLSSGDQNVAIDLGEVASGVYLLQTRGNGLNKTVKLMIE